MKKITSLLMICFIALSSFAQSVDLDREYMNVSYVRLPANPVIDAAFRTYSVQVSSSSNSSYSTDMIKDKIIIEGFEKVNSGGTVDVQIKHQRNPGHININCSIWFSYEFRCVRCNHKRNKQRNDKIQNCRAHPKDRSPF